MVDLIVPNEAVWGRCACGTELHFEDIQEERACMGLCSSNQPDMIRMVAGCDCVDGLPTELPCPHGCGFILHFHKDSKGRWVAHHQHCPQRPYRNGI
jgi:hypothetical protein